MEERRVVVVGRAVPPHPRGRLFRVADGWSRVSRRGGSHARVRARRRGAGRGRRGGARGRGRRRGRGRAKGRRRPRGGRRRRGGVGSRLPRAGQFGRRRARRAVRARHVRRLRDGVPVLPAVVGGGGGGGGGGRSSLRTGAPYVLWVRRRGGRRPGVSRPRRREARKFLLSHSPLLREMAVSKAPVIWAQRAGSVYFTVNVPDVKDAQISLTETTLVFKGTSRGTAYEATLEFFAEIDPKAEVRRGGRRARGGGARRRRGTGRGCRARPRAGRRGSRPPRAPARAPRRRPSAPRALCRARSSGRRATPRAGGGGRGRGERACAEPSRRVSATRRRARRPPLCPVLPPAAPPPPPLFCSPL